jgi:hypothetical protein
MKKVLSSRVLLFLLFLLFLPIMAFAQPGWDTILNRPNTFTKPQVFSQGASFLAYVGIGTTSPQRTMHVVGVQRWERQGQNIEFNPNWSLLNTDAACSVLEDKNLRFILRDATIGYVPLFLGTGGNVGVGGTAANTSPVIYAGATGNVGIRTTAPASALDVSGTVSVGTVTAIANPMRLTMADNGTGITIKANAIQASVTTADTYVDFRSTTGSEGSIAGTEVAGVIAYNTFTGSHYTCLIDADKDRVQVGDLLEAVDEPITVLDWPKREKDAAHFENVEQPVYDENGKPVMVEKRNEKGEVIFEAEQAPSGPNPAPVMVQKRETVQKLVAATYYEASTKPQLFKSRICRTKGSKAAIGVWGGRDKEGRDMVLAIGTGVVKVVNTGVNLEIGDLLISSARAGCVEVQDDDIVRNKTVAKITQNVKWEAGETVKWVKCIYLGG